MKAAKAGSAEAQFTLGALYQQGLGLPRDPKQAVFWYFTAADQGHILAQFNLAYCYESGQGVDKDLGRAARWYGEAANQGDEEARAALEDLEQVIKESAPPASLPNASSPTSACHKIDHPSQGECPRPISSPCSTTGRGTHDSDGYPETPRGASRRGSRETNNRCAPTRPGSYSSPTSSGNAAGPEN